MFCRYCGAHIADDSVFCAKCGKRLGRRSNPRVERAVRVLRLNTPYPYFILLFVVFAVWMLTSGKPPVDYTSLKLTMAADRSMDLREDGVFEQGFSLDLENAGPVAVREIPIELSAQIEPAKPAEVIATFRGLQLPIMQGGIPRPLVVVLSDEVTPGAKRHFSLGGSIHADPPFKVTYEIRAKDSDTVLASFVVER